MNVGQSGWERMIIRRGDGFTIDLELELETRIGTVQFPEAFEPQCMDWLRGADETAGEQGQR